MTTIAEKAQQLILERQQLAIRLNEINGALALLDEMALAETSEEVSDEETTEEYEAITETN